MKMTKEMTKEIAEEMVNWFDERTLKHINLVRKYLKKFEGKFPQKELEFRMENHDSTKLKSPEKEPYIYLTWKYKQIESGDKNYTLPKDIENRIRQATLHHIKSNRHHPEFSDPENNQDKSSKSLVDGTNMTDLDLAEMVADWCAMSEEKGGSPVDWAKKNIDTRWKFTLDQTNKIYEYLKICWEE